MSFFELDGGKPKARKSTKPKAKTTKTKKAPAKKSSGKKSSGKKSKKGGNFLGTVSELFAPAGWENFVTAAGLLALDRTDNFLRKSKDSKKQRGGVDDTPKMEEAEMTGGARKKSSSRKQRGGSDGHHTVETLDAMMGSGEEQEMTGGAKKSKTKGKRRKQKGGEEFMTPEQKQRFLEIYNSENHKTNNNKSTNSSRRIQAILEKVGVHIDPNAIGQMDTAISEARQLIKNRNFNQSLQQQANAQRENMAQQAPNMAQQAPNMAQQANIGQPLFGGKKSPKKTKKTKSKAKKPTKGCK
jgi:hypothetical protein